MSVGRHQPLSSKNPMKKDGEAFFHGLDLMRPGFDELDHRPCFFVFLTSMFESDINQLVFSCNCMFLPTFPSAMKLYTSLYYIIYYNKCNEALVFLGRSARISGELWCCSRKESSRWRQSESRQTIHQRCIENERNLIAMASNLLAMASNLLANIQLSHLTVCKRPIIFRIVPCTIILAGRWGSKNRQR